MSKLSLKALLGVGGVGVAGAVSAGLYLGLGNSATLNNNSPAVMQQVSSDTPEQVVDGVSYSDEGGRDMPIALMPGVKMTEELRKQLQDSLERGDESDMDDLGGEFDDLEDEDDEEEDEGEWETVEEEGIQT